MHIYSICFLPKFLNNLNFLANSLLFVIIAPPCPIVINFGILNEKELAIPAFPTCFLIVVTTNGMGRVLN